jgi:glycine cleavage system H protein
VFPDDLKYTAEHEWVRLGDAGGDDGSGDGADVATIGITDYAQEALGDIVYVSLPEVGETLAPGASVGELESTKSVSDVYAPLTGTVAAVNEALDGTPELVNSDAYGEGWLFELVPADAAEVEGLMDAAAYQASVES